MATSPDEIRAESFPTVKKGGLDPEAVSTYLSSVADDLAAMQTERDNALAEAQAAVEAAQQRAQTAAQANTGGTRVSDVGSRVDEVLAAAQLSADAIVGDAEQWSTAQRADADSYAQAVRSEVDELRRTTEVQANSFREETVAYATRIREDAENEAATAQATAEAQAAAKYQDLAASAEERMTAVKAAERDLLTRLDATNEELERARGHFQQAVASHDLEDEALPAPPVVAVESDVVEGSVDAAAMDSNYGSEPAMDTDAHAVEAVAGDTESVVQDDAGSDEAMADVDSTLEGWEDDSAEPGTEWGSADAGQTWDAEAVAETDANEAGGVETEVVAEAGTWTPDAPEVAEVAEAIDADAEAATSWGGEAVAETASWGSDAAAETSSWGSDASEAVAETASWGSEEGSEAVSSWTPSDTADSWGDEVATGTGEAVQGDSEGASFFEASPETAVATAEGEDPLAAMVRDAVDRVTEGEGSN